MKKGVWMRVWRSGVGLCLALGGVGGAQELPTLGRGPYAVVEEGWDFGWVGVSDPEGGEELVVKHFGVVRRPVVAGELGERALVVFAHGRFQVEGAVGTNHLQASYLLEHLASWGLVAVAVNLDVVGQYAFPVAIEQRAELLHATIEGFAADRLGLGLVVERVGLVGHSRGGEAALEAVVTNPAGHPIRAVAALAPTSFLAREVDGVPYLGMYGSLDGDVGGGAPLRAYDRVGGPEKAFEYVVGANHFGFTDSRVWYGEPMPQIDRAWIHAATRTCVAWFLLQTLAAQPGPAAQPGQGPRAEPGSFAELCAGPELARLLERVKLRPMYARGDALVVNDFETGGPGTNTLGGRSSGVGFALLEERRLFEYEANLFHATHGLALAHAGGAPAYVEMLGEPRDVSGLGFVSLRATQTIFARENEAGAAQDLSVVLMDADGRRASVRLAEHGAIPWPASSGGPIVWKSVLRTSRLPLAAFAAAAPGLDLSRVTALGLVLDVTGSAELRVDDLAFTD